MTSASAFKEPGRAGDIEDLGGDKDEADEQGAVDRALDGAGAPVIPGRVPARRPPGEPVEHDAGQQIDDRPQARLRERGADGGEDDRDDRPGDELRRIGDQRRHGGVGAAEGKERKDPQRPRAPVEADDDDQGQHRLADEPERQRAPDRHLNRKRQRRMQGDGCAEFGHVPVGADDDEEVEEEGDGDQAQASTTPQPAKPAISAMTESAE